ncbi:hypothetical protein M422DRAFT_70001 [Sphaerobolus stellatus SS14]|uniref:F-box domain-containing protein n=1 Tax=Sphaerobolus stellatus (strain SS14) TaxID=990650 RepID=A0A0C9TXA2_SPHS4|nr:hypothetical protein M422DRAFT_70001 [Sphaerobolus stellatus SS14]
MLPAELLLHIVSEVEDNRDLLSLSRASKLFSQEALEHLEWRHLRAYPGRLSLWIFIATNPRFAWMIRHLSLLDNRYSFFHSVQECLPRSFQYCPLDTLVHGFEKPTPATVLEYLPMAINAMSFLNQFSWLYRNDAPADLSKCIYPALQYTPPLKRLDVSLNDEETSNVLNSLRGVYPANITHLFVTVLESVPSACITPVVDCIIADYPSLIHLYLSIEVDIAIPNILERGRWPGLRQIALEPYGSLFDPTMPTLDAPRRAANIMTNFLRRHTKLESFWIYGEWEYYQGCLPEEGHPSLRALDFGNRFYDNSDDFHLVVPRQIIKQLRFLQVMFKFPNGASLDRFAQAETLSVCRISVSIQTYFQLLSVLPLTLERLELRLENTTTVPGPISSHIIVSHCIDLGYFDKFHNLVYLAGVLEIFFKRDTSWTQKCLQRLVNLPKLAFLEVESRSTWVKIVRDEIQQPCALEDLDYSSAERPYQWAKFRQRHDL